MPSPAANKLAVAAAAAAAPPTPPASMESSFRLIDTDLDTNPLAAAAFALGESAAVEQSPPPSPKRGEADGAETPRVVLPPRWEEAEQCQLCHKQFGSFTREHHCRRCGAAVCNTCSPQRLRLPHLGITERVRVCVRCALEAKSQAEEDTVETGGTIACYADVVPVIEGRVMMSWNDMELARADGGEEEVELGSLSPSRPGRSSVETAPTVRVQIERSDEGAWGVSVDDAGCVTDVEGSRSGMYALSPGVRITAVDAEPVDTGAAVLAALQRNREGEAVLTVAAQPRASAGNELAQSDGDSDPPPPPPPPPLLPTLRLQQASAMAALPLLGEDARKYRVICEMPPTDEDPLPAMHWVASSDDETQMRTVYRDCVEDCLQPLLSPVIAHQLCQDCGAVSPTFNLPDQTVGRWCKDCAAQNHRGAVNVVCHAVWVRELKRLVMQRRVVRSSRRRPYTAYLRLQPGFASGVEENHAALEPGVYTFQLWFDQSPGVSLLFSLSMLLNQQQPEPPSTAAGVMAAAVDGEADPAAASAAAEREPLQQRQAIFAQNEPIEPESEQRFRIVVPANWRGQLNASYRTTSPSLVNVRHKFARDSGCIPRSQIQGVRPRYLDAEGNLRRVRVLSMDGGGVRGTAEAMILMEMLRHTERHGTTKKVHEQFDLICGTSTGGLFALALGLRGIEPAELRKLWGEKAGKIFSREWNFMGRKITEETQKFGDMHLGLLSDRLKYDHKNLEAQINEYFEGEFMDTQKWLKEKTAKVCVVSHLLDVVPLTPYVMRSYELPPEVTKEAGQVAGASPFAMGDWRLSCLEAGRATAAAPTYFEPLTVWRSWETRLLLGKDTSGEDEQLSMGAGEAGAENVEELVARPTREDVLADLALEDGEHDGAAVDQVREERQRRLKALASSDEHLPTGRELETAAAAVAPTAGNPSLGLVRSTSGRRVVEMRRPQESEIAALRANLQKKYSLSTIVRFENRTAQTISKIQADLLTGVWEPGWMPPNIVGPFEEVVWACGGTMWGRSNGGVVRYSQSYDGGAANSAAGGASGAAGAPAASQTVTIEWDNPWVLRPQVEDLRRYEASVSARRDLVASVHTLDGIDRATNPFELRCVVERMGEARAYSVVEDPRSHFDQSAVDGGREHASEARMEGFLDKKQPAPGFRWQSRWFHLGADGTLRYFVTSLDSDGDQTQELKGVMHLRNVSAIDEAVGHETEFMIEHLEKPKKRQYHLRAESKELRTKWLDKLREDWTPAEPETSGAGFSADEDGRSAEARRYKSMRFSDGGTVANNPTFIALQEAWALYGAPGSSLHEFVGRQVDCVVSVGTGDPPPRRLRDGMGFKELVWEVLEHHTTSRDTDVFLSQMLPNNRYVRRARSAPLC